MNIEERNQHVQYILRVRLEKVKSLTEGDFLDIDDRLVVEKILTDLIHTKANGFRGVVLTALIGMAINNKYNPLLNFYDCNPRSIFENSIWYVLTEYNIPCGKSDPLNVAKNIQELNESWAEGRRPQSAALAAVKFLRLVIGCDDNEKKIKLIDYFYFKLMSYANIVAGIEITNRVFDHKISKQKIAAKLCEFSLNAPESGAIPQLIVGKLLKMIFASSSLSVHGDEESVFGTNTTSKKPADIWVANETKIIMLFEVTVKKVDIKRLEDCLASLRTQNITDALLTFICRLPQDVASLENVEDNNLIYKGITFDFLDYSQFIHSSLALISDDQVNELLAILHSFVDAVTTSIKAKNVWNQVFSG